MQHLDKYIAIRREMMVGALMPYIIVGAFLTLVMYVLVAIGLWKMFEKAGEPGWKALIPVYNFYILFKISWSTLWFWVSLVCAAFTIIFSNLRVGTALASVFVFIVILVFIVMVVINCIAMYKVSIAYEKSAIYTLGLVFLPYVFLMIIGLGEAKYKYSSGVPDAVKKFISLEAVKNKFMSTTSKQTKKIVKKATKKPTATAKKTTAKKSTKKAGTKKTSNKSTAKKSSSRKAQDPIKKSDYKNPNPKIDF